MDKTCISYEKMYFKYKKARESIETKIEKGKDEVSSSLQAHMAQYNIETRGKIDSLNKEENDLLNDFYETFQKEVDLKRKWRLRFVGLLGRQREGKNLPEDGGPPLKDRLDSTQMIKDWDSIETTESKENKKNTSDNNSTSKNYIIPWEEISFNKANKLGEGAFGIVYRGMCKGSIVAVKILKEVEEKNLKNFEYECMILGAIKHDNVLRFMGACIEKDKHALLTELAENGTLWQVLHPSATQEYQVRLSFLRKMTLAQEIVDGMNALHMMKPHPIVHLDLKTSNILLNDDWHVKIADFGMSKIKSVDQLLNLSSQASVGGTPLYMAPELLQPPATPSEKCDVYSFGIILWELFTEKVPYQKEFDDFDKFVKAVCKDARPIVPSYFPPSLDKLITNCWDKDPQKRPSFQTLKDKNTWFGCILEATTKSNDRCMKFWKKMCESINMPNATEVPWKTFLSHFGRAFGADSLLKQNDLFQSALFAVLDVDENSKEIVTLPKFERFVKWFGPITNAPTTMNKLLELLKQPWFHGQITGEEATNKLRSQPSGTYLVRYSSQERAFTISYSLRNSDKKVTIQHRRFENGSLHNHVETYVKQHGLKNPCPDRPAKYAVLQSKIKSLNSISPLYTANYAGLTTTESQDEGDKDDIVNLDSNWTVGQDAVNFIV